MTPGFYRDNANRSFPFVVGQTGQADGAGLQPLPDAAIVDCGFVGGATADAFEVTLVEVRRQSGRFDFDFANSANDIRLRFSRDVGSRELVHSFVESDPPSGDDDQPWPSCAAPYWWGYLVTGDLSSLEALLADGDALVGAAAIEPALVQLLAGTAVETLNFANDNRTQASAADGCDEPVWALPNDRTLLAAACVASRTTQRYAGFVGGYNAVVSQNGDDELVFSARVGAGLGEPCGEVPLLADEIPPAGTSLLDGSPACAEVVRSLGGVTGPNVLVDGGPGVTVAPDAQPHILVITVTAPAEA